MVATGHDPEAPLGPARGDVREQPEIAPRIGADREHVRVDDGVRVGSECVHVDAERHEDDGGSALAEPVSQPRSLALGIRDDRARAAERIAYSDSSRAGREAGRAAPGSPIAV